jgi:Leucine-rich repeat (LRR) protein
LDNQLTGSSLKPLLSYSNLFALSLGGNPLSTFEDLQPLTQLRNLKELDFIDCPVSNLPEYREKLFQMFQNLEILDSVDRDGNLVEDEEEEEEEEEEEFSEEEDG